MPYIYIYIWLPRWLSGKEFTCQCRTHKRQGFDSWVGKIFQRRKWQSLQYHCLENSMDRGAWQARVHQVEKHWTRLSMHACVYIHKCIIESLCCIAEISTTLHINYTSIKNTPVRAVWPDHYPQGAHSPEETHSPRELYVPWQTSKCTGTQWGMT